MATYADYFTPNCYFVTNYAVGGELVLGNALLMHLLRTVLTQVQQRHPFRSLGYVFLPDHLHLMAEPTGRTVLDQLMTALHERFQHDYQQVVGMPSKLLLWETHYHTQRLSTIEEFAERLDYLHYNPVYHHYVAKPEAWPYSSYPTWMERGLYQPGWGWQVPDRIQGKRWE
ncbi:MAG: hypothetical protein R3C14_51665 [Caldilineaceae bacterium]